MDFLREAISGAVGGRNEPPGPPPDVPRPWYAEWDNREEKWLFINQETGDRTFDFPSGYGVGEGISNWAGRKVGEAEDIPQNIDNDYNRMKYGAEQRFDGAVNRMENVPQDVAYGAGEAYGEAQQFGQKVENIPNDMRQDYDNFENRVEGGFDRFANRVEDVPQDIAYGAGKAYGEVQNFGQEVEGGFDRFGDRVDNYADEQQGAFDAGRDEGRRDDDY